MILPIHPIDLKTILYDEFIKVISGVSSDMEWSTFSGKFNRHCRRKAKKASRKEKLWFQYLFQVWLAMHTVYLSRISFRKVFQRKQTVQRLENIRNLFEELLEKYEKGLSFKEMMAIDNPVILKELEEVFNFLKQGK